MAHLFSITSLAQRRSRPRAFPARSFPDNEALVAALKDDHPQAPAELFDRYGQHVQRVLTNVLGYDPELEDLLHEVFVRVLTSIHKLRDHDRLKAWITSIAVFTARSCIRARTRRRLLGLHHTLPQVEVEAPSVPQDVREAMGAMYRVLDRLPANERIAFSLRFVSGMELVRVAEACEVSLATIKRRLKRAESRFFKLAKQHPVLCSWVEEGERWGAK